MLFALVVMAGVLLVTIVFNNRREPSWWESRRSGWDGGRSLDGLWAFGNDSGGDSAVTALGMRGTAMAG
jgi:hypothetical protein